MALSDQELRNARDIGGAAFLSAYTRLMARALKVDDSDDVAMNDMASQMVQGLNLGTEATWRALMGDQDGVDETLERLRRHLKTLKPEIV